MVARPWNHVIAFGRWVFTREDSLLAHSLLLVLVTLGAALINSIYQLVMGRMLGPAQYAALGALLSATYLLGVLSRALTISTARSVAVAQASGGTPAVGSCMVQRVKLFLFIGLIGMIAVWAGSDVLSEVLRLKSHIPVMILGGVFCFQILQAIVGGTLQGLQRFGRFGTANILGLISQLVVAMGLVVLGFGVVGALSAVGVGAGITVLVGASFLRDVIWGRGQCHTAPKAVSLNPENVLPTIDVIIGYLMITLFYTADIVLVNLLFESTVAGYYVAASTIARLIFFIGVPVAQAMLPKVTKCRTENGDMCHRLGKSALLYAGIIAGVSTLILNLLPHMAIRLTFGSAYGESTRLVGLFAVGMLFLSLTYVLVLYQLALRRKSFLVLLAAGPALQLAGIYAFHESLRQVVTVFVAATGVTLASLGLFTWIQGRRQRFSNVGAHTLLVGERRQEQGDGRWKN